MGLVKYPLEQRAPLTIGVPELSEKVLAILSPGQKRVFFAVALSFDTSRLSQSIKGIARVAKQPGWLVVQELHYIEHVIRLLSYDVVAKKGVVPRGKMFSLFPLLAPIEKLGIQKEFCDLFRHDLKRRLKKDVSIGYIREFFSLGIREKDLQMKAGVSRALIREVNRNLRKLSLPSLDDSEERKMLSRFLTKNMQHYRNGLTSSQMKWLDIVRWGGVDISDVFSEYQLSNYGVSDMKNKAKNFLLNDPVFHRSPLLDRDFTGDLSEFERSY